MLFKRRINMKLDSKRLPGRRSEEEQAERIAAEYVVARKEGDEHPMVRLKRFLDECKAADKAKRKSARRVNTTKSK
jgi:hypothetical protein